MKTDMLKTIFAVLLLAVAVMALVIGRTVYLDSQSCTVGVAGAAASFTLQGENSPDICQSLVDSNRPGNTQLYLMTATPQGTVLCEGEYHYQGSGTSPTVHYIVRDTGLFDLVGKELCQYFERTGQ